MKFFYCVFLLTVCIAGMMDQSHAQVWNNPHLQSGAENTAYFAFTNPPKTLDPARSYSSDESQFTAQIYEPPLQYHYLKRPYALTTLSAAELPAVSYFDAKNQRLPDENLDPQKIAYTRYDISIQPHIFYQPHPAFAKDATGAYRYHHLTSADLNGVRTLTDFLYSGTRELTADDFVYEIKRLGDPAVQSPIFGLMSQYIIGLKELSEQLQAAYHNINQTLEITPYVDLRRYPLEGAQAIDRYHYQIKIKGFYPQFQYWLAMPFFAPVPWEAFYFYSQPGMADRNITLDWYPVGTGPYLLTENNPNRQMILSRNPNFRGEQYPTEGEPEDLKAGYLEDAGKKMPFIDTAVFTLDRESIPRWNKFMQGYYDISGVSADSFNQAIHLDKNGAAHLTPELIKKAMRLSMTPELAIYYMGFNMLDPVVGGNSVSAQKLRLAISIALDEEEFISIFLNGRGIPAQGPIPPGIFGNQEGESGINPWVFEWKNNRAVRKPLSEAQALMEAAGYPQGRDPKTGQPLILNYDIPSSGSPDDHAAYNWYRKQFAKLGIELNIRATLYNRFQDKMRSGSAQIFSWGWLADYPDPENFLFLLYGPNGKVKFGGENAANYDNPKADMLFKEIANLQNSEQRQQKIAEFLKIVREDNPWDWGFNPIDFRISQPWVGPMKPNAIAKNTLKYMRINGALRLQLREQWNLPRTWPLWSLLILALLLSIPLIMVYYRREYSPSIRRF